MHSYGTWLIHVCQRRCICATSAYVVCSVWMSHRTFVLIWKNTKFWFSYKVRHISISHYTYIIFLASPAVYEWVMTYLYGWVTMFLNESSLALNLFSHHLRCLTVCCSVVQCRVLCCSVLQCVAVCCSVLQCVAVYHLVRSSALVSSLLLVSSSRHLRWAPVCCSVMQCICSVFAVCCSMSPDKTIGTLVFDSSALAVATSALVFASATDPSSAATDPSSAATNPPSAARDIFVWDMTHSYVTMTHAHVCYVFVCHLSIRVMTHSYVSWLLHVSHIGHIYMNELWRI